MRDTAELEPGEPGGAGTVVAGIPCFNTAAHIADVVARTRPYVDVVLVVDDGSTDGTGDIAAKAGATVVSHVTNMGYGCAIGSCFKYAYERGACVLVTVDGDGQHYPEDIPALLKPIQDGVASLVVGSRFLPGAEERRLGRVPAYRAFGIGVITLLFNFGAAWRVSDSQNGLRAYDRLAIGELMPSSTSMEASVEILVAARSKRIAVAEVPVGFRYHEGSSTLHPIPHGIRVACWVVWLRMRSLIGRCVCRSSCARQTPKHSRG